MNKRAPECRRPSPCAMACFVVIALTTALLSGCAKSVVVDSNFPEPVVPALPLNIGVYYEPALANYKYAEELPNDVDWSFDIGAANIRLFESIFSALFDITSAVEGKGGSDPVYAGLDAVIVPAIEAFEFSLPRQSRSEQYAVWIRYNLHIYSPAGTLITSWPVSAYGQSDTRNFGADEAMEQAVITAMRDAAASIIIGFAKNAKIKEALLSNDSDL